MERIPNSTTAEAKVLRDMQEFIATIRTLSTHDVKDLPEGIAQLRTIRSSIYEDLNQIQHEYLLMRGLEWLLKNGFDSVVDWEWNPRQTGSGEEPDLRGCTAGRIVVSGEASSSENPRGMVDQRMRETLNKLNNMEGQKFYFVGTASMEKRAITKVHKAGWSIKVVLV